MKLIAVSARKEFFDGQNRYFCNEAYIDSLKKNGCLPIIVTDSNYLDVIASKCDGLIINGGDDINPVIYHQTLNPHSILCPSEIDEFDLQAIAAFIKLDKPILGICRGLQVLNVYFNGDLIQHMDDNIKHADDHHLHLVNQVSSSFLNKLYPSNFIVNSYHHQCIKQLGSGLIACAISHDGIIEAIAHQDKKIIAVQWHPEKLLDDKIIAYFVNEML
ncbi:MAG: gamma-glutamyl-gamma-aminobutyrate hydrolase family protein [Erysipelotrichaceae bacterium]